MKFFVTGATGFIGLHLCKRLVADGHEVHALVRSPQKGRALPPEASIVEGDLRLFQDESFELPETDVFVHLAGVVAAESEQQYWEINYSAVKDIAACLARQKVPVKRMLFASSLAAAGPSHDRPKIESDAASPIDPYGQAKHAAEVLLEDAPFPVTSFRPSLVLGPGDPASLTLFKLANRGLGFRVAGKAQQLSFVAVSDLIDAILLMANEPTDGKRTYFVAHPHVLCIDELWQALGKALDRRVVIVPIPRRALRLGVGLSTWLSGKLGFTNQLDGKQYQQMTAPAWTCDSSALISDLGWSPTVDLHAGATEAASWYRSAGWLRR
jgi:nucleoside-diphosphate-sugar epimerase